jgi:hypothetical protein
MFMSELEDDMAKEVVNEPLVATYMAFKSFLSAVAALRSHGLPQKLDKSAWGSRSGGEQSAIWSAFKFLGLIDDAGTPQEALKKLVATKEGTAEEKEVLKGILHSRYKAVFDLDLSTATPLQLAEAIGEYNVTGTTRDRAVLFFIKACEHVGIKITDRLKKGFRSTPSKRNGSRTRRVDEGDDDEDEQPAADGSQIETITLPDVGGTLTITGTFNVFRLAGAERELVFGIVDMMRAFAEKAKGRKD